MADTDIERAKSAFWRQHLRIAFWVLTGESISVAMYFAIEPGPQRSLLISLAVISALSGLVAISLVVDHVAGRPWRETFSLAWTMGSGLVLALVVFVDGGFDSPLLVLLSLPVVYAALTFSPRRVAACGMLELVELAVVSGYHSQRPPLGGEILIWAAGGVGLMLLAVTTASNRSRLEQIEHQLREELAQLASHDSLTGCLNHGAFTARLEEETARAVRHGWPLTVLAADVDDFKKVNDRHGHQQGDAVLVSVAQAMRGDLRSGDFVGRLGGDEFTLVLPHTSLSGAVARVGRIQRAIGATSTASATVSIGIGALSHDCQTAGELLELADRALYAVKRTKRAGTAVTHSASLTALPTRARLHVRR